jgi:hypothetical protein
MVRPAVEPCHSVTTIDSCLTVSAQQCDVGDLSLRSHQRHVDADHAIDPLLELAAPEVAVAHLIQVASIDEDGTPAGHGSASRAGPAGIAKKHATGVGTPVALNTSPGLPEGRPGAMS